MANQIKGKISQIIGPVIDVVFTDVEAVPAIYDALEITKENGEIFTTKNPNYFSMNMLNYYEGWHCNVGVNYLYIDRTGVISGTCKQKLYGLDFYYNLYDKNFLEKYNPNITGVICEQKICMCGGEASLTKNKIL